MHKQQQPQQNGSTVHERFKNLAEVHEYGNAHNSSGHNFTHSNNINIPNNRNMTTLSNHFGNNLDETITSSNVNHFNQNNNVELPSHSRRRNSANSKPDLSPNKFHINEK